MAEEAKKYLDYDGLKHLVEKLTNKIEASGGGGTDMSTYWDLYADAVKIPVLEFSSEGDGGVDLGPAGKDAIPLLEIIDNDVVVNPNADDERYWRWGGGRFVTKIMLDADGMAEVYIACTEPNDTGGDIYAVIEMQFEVVSTGEKVVLPFVAVQSAAAASASDGVYAGYTDADGVNRIVSPDKWDDSLGTLCGVAVVEGGRGLLVAPADLSSASNFGTTVGDIGGATTTDEAAALCDTDGRMNTLLARAAGAGEASAAAVALSAEYSYGTVCARRWFIGGLGQWAAVGRRYDEVNSALSALGGSGLGYGLYFWTSTQYNSGNVWIYNASTMRTSRESAGNTGLITTWPGRAFAEWDYVL